MPCGANLCLVTVIKQKLLNMKNLHQHILLIIVVLFLGCTKDKMINYNHKTFDVHVQKLINKEGVSDYELCFRKIKFFKLPGSTRGSILQDTILLTIKTNRNGDARFSVHINLLQNDTNVFYVIGGLEALNDTVPNGKNSNWEFQDIDNRQVYYKGEQKITNLNYNLISKWNCPAAIVTNKDDWAINAIDSLIVSSNIVKDYNCSNPDLETGSQYYVKWVTDCSKVSTVNYYYYSMGKKSKNFSMQIEYPQNVFFLNFK